MAGVVQIAGKDLRQRLRDRSAIMLALVVPFVLAAIFSLIFGPASTPRPFDYVVVDHDRSQITRGFTEEVLRPLAAEQVVTVQSLSETVALAAVRDGSKDAAFIFPAGFSAKAQTSERVSIRVVGSVDSATATDVARSIARSYAANLNAARVAAAAVAHQDPAASDADLAAVAAAVIAADPPLRLDDVSTTARVLDAKTYFAAGLAVFFLLFTVQFGVSSLIEERAQGTLTRMLAAPVRRLSIFAGKLLTSVVLGVVSMTVLILASTWLLGATWGNPVGVAMLVLSGVLAGTGITALVATLARTPEQTGSWQAVIAVVLGLLGGSFFPIQQSGSVMATVSLVTPHAWFLRGLGTMAGGELGEVLPAVVALLCFAVVTGTVAVLRIDRVMAP
jgi:ABC-2 type transport system permease protein